MILDRLGTRFKIERSNPAKPRGPVFIDYDAEEDTLWIGIACKCTGEECIHATAATRLSRENNLIIMTNITSFGTRIISSIGLLNATRHPIWPGLFKGLEVALRRGTPMQFKIYLSGLGLR